MVLWHSQADINDWVKIFNLWYSKEGVNCWTNVLNRAKENGIQCTTGNVIHWMVGELSILQYECKRVGIHRHKIGLLTDREFLVPLLIFSYWYVKKIQLLRERRQESKCWKNKKKEKVLDTQICSTKYGYTGSQ